MIEKPFLRTRRKNQQFETWTNLHSTFSWQSLTAFSFSANEATCRNCGEGQYCCDGDCLHRSGCLDRYCARDDHWSTKACCNSKCTNRTNRSGWHCENNGNCMGHIFCGQKCVNASNGLGRRFQRQSDEQCSEGEICCSFRCVSSPNRSGYDWEKGDQCSVGQRCCRENAWTLQNALDVLVIETNIALMVKFVAILNASTGRIT